MNPKIGLIIQSRLGSSRLPKKSAKTLFGLSILEHVVNRCYLSKLVNKIVIACPESPEVCLNEEIFIGSENDVLDRFYKCAEKYSFDVIVRITADCPLIPPYEIDRTIKRLLERDTHYVRSATLDGYDVEAFTFFALEKAWNESKDLYDREHVTPYMKCDDSINPINLEALKLSLDTALDLETIKEYYELERKAYLNNGRNWEFCQPLSETYSSNRDS